MAKRKCGPATSTASEWGRWLKRKGWARKSAIRNARKAAGKACTNDTCINEDGLRSHCIYFESKCEELEFKERGGGRKRKEYRYKYKSSGGCECESRRTRGSCGPASSSAEAWGEWRTTEAFARKNAVHLASKAAEVSCEGPSKVCINANNLRSHCEFQISRNRQLDLKVKTVKGRKRYRMKVKVYGQCACH